MNTRSGRDRAAAQAYRVQLPLLDRLIDDDPDAQQDPPVSAAEALAVLRHSVRRDIEALLNARRRWRSWPRLLRGAGGLAGRLRDQRLRRRRLQRSGAARAPVPADRGHDPTLRAAPGAGSRRRGRYGQPARSDAAAAHRGAAAHRAGARADRVRHAGRGRDGRSAGQGAPGQPARAGRLIRCPTRCFPTTIAN